MSSNPIKILLVEDDELFRLGLRVRLQQEADLEIVAEAEDGETAIELVKASLRDATRTTPLSLDPERSRRVKQNLLDVVLLDMGLPGIGGIEACRQIKQQNPQLPILVLTSHSQTPLITRLIEVGAQGYCLKGIAAEKLILALRSVTAGASWWDATATQEIRSSFIAEASSPELKNIAKAVNPLTQREQEILSLLAAGKNNQEIAHALYIAPGTVRVHIHAILQKLAVSDRTQAVIVALQKHLIKSSP